MLRPVGYRRHYRLGRLGRKASTSLRLHILCIALSCQRQRLRQGLRGRRSRCEGARYGPPRHVQSRSQARDVQSRSGPAGPRFGAGARADLTVTCTNQAKIEKTSGRRLIS